MITGAKKLKNILNSDSLVMLERVLQSLYWVWICMDYQYYVSLQTWTFINRWCGMTAWNFYTPNIDILFGGPLHLSCGSAFWRWISFHKMLDIRTFVLCRLCLDHFYYFFHFDDREPKRYVNDEKFSRFLSLTTYSKC